MIKGFRTLWPGLYQPPVLVYHAVLASGEKEGSIPVAQLNAQMKFLQDAGLEILPLDTLLNGPRRRGVFLTFDDGETSFYEHAWPLLKHYSYPACLFVIAERIGAAGYMNKEQLNELVGSGLITIGSHTMGHRFLPELTDSQIQAELAGSKAFIEAAVCRSVNFLAYPWGGFTPRIEEAARQAGYLLAFTTNQGFKGTRGAWDPFAVKRMTIKAGERAFSFMAKCSGMGTCFSRTIKM